MRQTNLFSPLTIRGVTFSNRMFVPPMDLVFFLTKSYFQYASDSTGVVSDVNLGYYASYAERSFGGIIQEATAVLAEGRISPWYILI